MSRRFATIGSLCAVALVVGAFLAGRASSEEPPAGMPPEMAEMMKEWTKMKTPGPQHELLKTFAGTFTGTGQWTEQGMTSKFTEQTVGKMIYGGRFLQIESSMTTEASPPMPPMSMTSTMFLGFDNAKQKYVHAMLGDWSTSIGASEGTYDEATKTFTMTGVEVMSPEKSRKYRMVQKVVSNDEWKFEMYFEQPDGSEAKAGEAVYKRKK
jgi:hypothetical protein